VLIGFLRDFDGIGVRVATRAAEALGEMGAAARAAIPVLRAASAGDVRPSFNRPQGVDILIQDGAFYCYESIVIEDERFCSAVAEALRRIQEDS
jgi:hypothetical protein